MVAKTGVYPLVFYMYHQFNYVARVVGNKRASTSIELVSSVTPDSAILLHLKLLRVDHIYRGTFADLQMFLRIQ